MHTFGRQLQNKAIATRHRLCIVLSGSQRWGEQSARAICAQYPRDAIVQVSNSEPRLVTDDAPKIWQICQTKQALGKEIATVIYDCFSGFDPDAVGQLGGAIKAGGLMVLIAPTLSLWPEFDDPQLAKITACGNPKPKVSYYIKRLIRIISTSPDCILIEQHKPLPRLSNDYQTLAKPADFSAQNHAIETIKHVVYGQRRRPAILLSDRGRGKSAALGIAAGQLLQGKVKRIGVTGNSKQSVANVFKHVALGPDIDADSLRFYPADKLIEGKPALDLLLVDEAASIPLSMLGRILEIFPRIAFASTVHGYEGTGRGFILRFQELLEHHCRGSQTCTLSAPIRWAQDDPLESFLFDVLLLNAEPAEIAPGHIDDSKFDIGKFEFGMLEKSDLVENESLLRDAFGLLTQAHYRTRPYDLRHLLDATNIGIFGIWQPGQPGQFQQKQIIGLAVVAIEGGFDDETANKIWANQARPQGHLLPELLCAQQGIIAAAKLKSARIMRIVVRPEFQRHGIGKSLLTHIFNFYSHQVDLLGTTFGANLAVLQFWLDSEFIPVRIGHNQSRNSATHACAMIKPVSPRGDQLATLAQNKFADNFGYQLRTIFPSLDVALVPMIYKSMTKSTGGALRNELGNGLSSGELSDNDLSDLVGFAFANQNMDNIPIALIRFTEIIMRANGIGQNSQQAILLVERILLGKSWKNCTALAHPKGKKTGVAELRKIIGAMLMRLYPKQIKPILAEFGIKP